MTLDGAGDRQEISSRVIRTFEYGDLKEVGVREHALQLCCGKWGAVPCFKRE